MEIWRPIVNQFEQNCARWIQEDPTAAATITHIKNRLCSFMACRTTPNEQLTEQIVPVDSLEQMDLHPLSTEQSKHQSNSQTLSKMHQPDAFSSEHSNSSAHSINMTEQSKSSVNSHSLPKQKVLLPIKLHGDKITSHSQFWIYSQSFPFPVQELPEPNTFLLYSDWFLLHYSHPERMMVNTWTWMESTMCHLYGKPISDATNCEVIVLYYKDDFVAQPICTCH
jgi:hypothetical protein